MHAKLVPTSIPLIAAALVLSACAADVPSETADANIVESELHTVRVDTVAAGLENPWSIAFLPGGDMLVTERPGRLRIVRDGALLPDTVPGLPEVRVGGQGGLLDVVPHPEFESNRLIYLSYSKPNEDGSEGTTAVIRGRLEDDALVGVEEIFEAAAWTSGRGHHGSRLAFDRDGYLFVTVGDRQARPAGDLEAHPAQDLTNHYGVTVRLHDDGRVPDDNPFVDSTGARPEIWSYGHRNPQGLTIHPETGEIWLNEHGPQGGDELNLVRPGVNYGWPVIGYGVNYGAGEPIHEAVRRGDMENPVHFWVPSIATSGLLVYTGEHFPAWQGDFLVGGLGGQVLTRLAMEDGRVMTEERLLTDYGRVRDVRQGPDGRIYVAIDAPRGGDGDGTTPVLRLEPVGAS